MPSEVDLLRSLSDEPDTPSTVNIRKAMDVGRRRRVRRSAGYAGAAALTAIAVTGTSVAINLAAGDQAAPPAPEAAAGGKPKPSASAPAVAPTAKAPAGCVIHRLKPPDNAPMALVSGADPTGKYVVGRSYPKAGGYQAVIWNDGKGKKVMLPGDSEESLQDVNSAGDAVGWSYQGEAVGPVPYAYAGGKVIKMRGPKYAEPRAINNAGVVVGVANGANLSAGAGLRWPSPTAEPVPLPVPAGTTSTRPMDIAEDGTIVGGLNFETPVMWTADGEMRELPMPEIDGRPAAVAQAFDVSDGWATGMASTEKIAPGSGGGAKSASAPIFAVRWNLRTGQAQVVKQLKDPADEVNALGWMVGTDAKGYATLVAGGTAVRLPDLGKNPGDGVTTIATTISDDGRFIAGQSDNKDEVIQAVVWRCE
ncbi:hypothetical protein [Actinoplanes sp. NPDC089786]|uniref:hypothetical protein n=1 Tax=Actinoplanes sp. NPDC089786 TaxID=3155185 RepID=UPI003431EDB9